MKTNLIIAPISISKGMAGTMLLQNIVNELRKDEDLLITNIITHKTENQIDDTYYYNNVSLFKLKYHRFLANFGNIYEIYTILKLRKIKENNVFFYYDINFNPLDFIIFVVAKSLNYKIVFYEVELYITKLFSKKEKGFLKIIMIAINQLAIKTIADHIFCISHNIKKIYTNNSSILPIIYNSELTTIRTANANKITTIFYGGSFAEKDNIEMLLEVARNIYTKGHKFILNLTGRCAENQYRNLLNLINRLNISHFVFYKGFLSNDDYYALLSEADICVVPRTNSNFSNSGFPLKLGEYLAMGKPTIVSNTGDISLYLTSEDVLFINPDYSEELENGLIQLITNNTLRTKLSKNAKQKALTHFAPSVHARNIIEIFNSLQYAK